jgi:SAM-dependent methyltransferase
MLCSFEDKFSSHAEIYARYRPTYPAALFERLADAAPGRELAWDCGTGNGQSAIALAPYFNRVIATDGSERQIAHARRHQRVHYRVALSEASGIPENSLDLITVSQALHWFDLHRFYDETKRVLKPKGVIAAWCYDSTIIDPAIDRLLDRYARTTLEQFWSPGARLTHDHYRGIPFPFTELTFPSFTAETCWHLSDLIGYLTSWSATQQFVRINGYSAVDELKHELYPVWGDPSSPRRIQWPLYLRVGLQGS